MRSSDRPDQLRDLRIVIVAALMTVAAAFPAAASFQDISSSAGIGLTDFTYGLAWSDLDGDGDQDLFVGRHFSAPVIYRNDGGGSFGLSGGWPMFVPSDHHGPVLADFDNDGDPDIYLTSGAEGGTGSEPAHFYRNDGGFSFENIAGPSGLADPTGRGRSCSAVDVDADGTLDIFVAKAQSAGNPNSLFLNDGTGSFQDVAATAGLADEFGSVGGIWGDFDRDGDADLFIGGSEATVSESRLYRNDGAVTFTDVTATMLPGLGQVAAAAWGDYDKDGDLDLAVGLGDEAVFDAVDTDFGSLRFFFNARTGENGVDGVEFFHVLGSTLTFEVLFRGYYDPTSIFIGSAGFHPTNSPFSLTAAEAAGQPSFVEGESVGLFIWTQSSKWFIRASTPGGLGNNFGGVLDATGFVVGVSTSDLEPYEAGERGTRVYRNDGAVFTDVTSALQISDGVNVRNVTWVDYDKDGRLDLHVMAKGDTKFQNEADVLYRNQTQSFADVTSQQQAAGPSSGLGDACAFEDHDGDGDLDLAILSGAAPRLFALQEADRLYDNVSSSSNSLRIDLVGVVSNRDGLGAWVTCTSNQAGTQSHYVAANAWGGAHVMTDPYFGLGPDGLATLVRVEWPSGVITELTDVPAGTVTIVETPPVDAPAIASPAALRLTSRPQPARGDVVFVLERPRPVPAVLEVFDAAGRLVFRQNAEPGTQEVSWNATDRAGHRVAAGVYYGVLRSAAGEARTKVVLLR